MLSSAVPLSTLHPARSAVNRPSASQHGGRAAQILGDVMQRKAAQAAPTSKSGAIMGDAIVAEEVGPVAEEVGPDYGRRGLQSRRLG